MNGHGMNCNLTFNELINYLDFYNNDPMVRKLLEYINDKEENIIEGLVQAGMDPIGCHFDYDGSFHSPGEMIEQLRNDVDYHEREAAEWEEKYYNMKEERNRLRARTVADIMAEMREQVKRAEADRNNSDRIAKKYEEENRELQQKINVWKVLES